MARTLLTGARGFVGANLARRLLLSGHEVHAVIRPGGDPWRLEEVRAAIRFHETDLADEQAVARCVAEIRPEWVFHLAAYGAYPSQHDLRLAVDTNVVGTMNLLLACMDHNVAAFINAGSSSEYGLKDHPPTEDEPLEPNSHYAVTKASATLICRQVARSRGLNLSTLRLYSVYGPFEEPTRFIPSLVTHGLRGQFPPLVRPDVARDFVYVDDVTEAFEMVAAAPAREPGTVYNVGSGTQTTIGQAVEAIRELLPIGAEPIWDTMPRRSWDTGVWVSDASRIRDAVGWEPRHSLTEGLGQTIRWFEQAPSRQSFYESRQALP